MKKWKIDVQASDGRTSTLKVAAATKQAAMEHALKTHAKVLSISELEEEVAAPPPTPEPAAQASPKPAAKKLSRSTRTEHEGSWMLAIGILGFVFGGCLASVVIYEDGGLPIALIPGGVASISALLIVVGIIYIAIGRLGLDIADRIAEATSRSDED